MSDLNVITTDDRVTVLSGVKAAINMSRCVARFKRETDGSTTVFTLFIFILMLLIGGMAVDLVRYETQRSHLQNTLDSATLAATNMTSTADPTQLVKDFMDKNGFDPNLVNVTPLEIMTGGDPANGIPGTLQARSVRADYRLDVNTMFMHMMGIDRLGAQTAGAAAEGIQAVEISLVLDVSGSMGNNGKLDALKVAAKNFVNQVIDPTRTVAVTSVSVIPYSHTVVVPNTILDRLNANGIVPIPAANQATYTGALTQYQRTSTKSSCVRFNDNELTTNDLQDIAAYDNDPNANYRVLRRITPTQPLDRMVSYDYRTDAGGLFGGSLNNNDLRCNPNRAEILPFETNILTLETYFDSLTASGWTSTDTGMKWGLALLDPGIRPVTNQMVNANELPLTVVDRPLNYDPSVTLKVMVVMTDGANTRQYDVSAPFKNGPSRIWYSAMAASDTGPNSEDWANDYIVDADGDGAPDRAKIKHDGYYVEMPLNPANQRFLRPLSPNSTSDGVLVGVSELPADAVQMSYTELYKELSVEAVASLFNDVNGDTAAYNAHKDAEIQVQNGASADIRMNGDGSPNHSGICDVAKVKNDVLVYTIAFQTSSHAEGVMRDCASGTNGAGFYFPADDATALNNAFSAIAGAITKLRLTQ